MGSDAEVFIFDYDAYVGVVVPGFRELLLTGESPILLDPALKRALEWRELQLAPSEPTDILRHCNYLREDLSWTGPYDRADAYLFEWGQRACRSFDCAERGHCPLHLAQPEGMAEELLWMFKVAVSIRCLGDSQFVGRSQNVVHYWNFLTENGLGPDDPLFGLLIYLGKRGLVIGYQWCRSNDGINGWLDPRETRELARRLDDLPLPRYETSFEAMKSFRKPHSNRELYERFGISGYDCPGYSFDALSLSFVRTVATIAARENQGILWGNNVSSEYPI